MKYFVTVIAEIQIPSPYSDNETDYNKSPAIISLLINPDKLMSINSKIVFECRERQLINPNYKIYVKQIIAFSPINEFYACMIESLTDKVTYLSLDAVQLPK